MEDKYNQMSFAEFFSLLRSRKLEYRRARKINRANFKIGEARAVELAIDKKDAKREISRTKIGQMENTAKSKNIKNDKRGFQLEKKDDKLQDKKERYYKKRAQKDVAPEDESEVVLESLQESKYNQERIDGASEDLKNSIVCSLMKMKEDEKTQEGDKVQGEEICL